MTLTWIGLMRLALGVVTLTVVCILQSPEPITDVAAGDNAPETNVLQSTQLRRPVALALTADDRWLVVANKSTGSVSVINAVDQKLVGEFKIGEQLADVAHVHDSNTFVAADQKSHCLVGFQLEQTDSARPKIVWQVKTVAFPTAISINPNENLIAVCGLWSRQIAIHKLATDNSAPACESKIDLNFNPGHACWIASDRLLVADSFGESVALLDASSKEVISSKITGHRTGGLTLSADGKHLVFADQRLNPLARSTRNDVHWGLMIANQLRWLGTEELSRISTEAEFNALLKKFDSQPVGGPDDAKADLGQLAICQNDILALTVGGVNELAIGKLDDDSFAYVPVGKRPIDVACSSDGKTGFVANQLDDSVSIVHLDDFEVVATIELGDTPELSLAGLGERLFFDARLSHDGWMSCHSCHVEGHTSDLLNDNFSDASFHTPKRVISLLGHGETLPLTWSGKHADFETQMKRSIESTMQSDETATDEQIKQLATFVRSLPPPPAVSSARDNVARDQLEKGKLLFENLDCVRCHAPPVYTTTKTYDLGIRDEKGESKFNPPSLIGLGQRDRYFHDGRYGNLTELLAVKEHEVPRELTDEELSDLIVFLKSL